MQVQCKHLQEIHFSICCMLLVLIALNIELFVRQSLQLLKLVLDAGLMTRQACNAFQTICQKNMLIILSVLQASSQLLRVAENLELLVLNDYLNKLYVMIQEFTQLSPLNILLRIAILSDFTTLSITVQYIIKCTSNYNCVYQ
ncbi:unnamed protein product (macronuclear) [Paramecium tetraurelia]|uniref:Transmembrane protein n=1 Tax=Paramecium tetraurelia TaxID=5888 RepID=A0BZL8_PARTE|nr:uncharacterized protein GSPATT00005837001 [Paramecium tetraurelia]CAK63985.1 unnamed protein product [Paramecium tetraurelia]|eukprot:XP_001431383.1 hypothetical protein (macronuclear) [Paramecium tetraurelia strain d4-2]